MLYGMVYKQVSPVWQEAQSIYKALDGNGGVARVGISGVHLGVLYLHIYLKKRPSWLVVREVGFKDTHEWASEVRIKFRHLDWLWIPVTTLFIRTAEAQWISYHQAL